LEQLKQKALTSKNQLKEKETKLVEHTDKIPQLQQQVIYTVKPVLTATSE
jgi:hypothetical protein